MLKLLGLTVFLLVGVLPAHNVASDPPEKRITESKSAGKGQVQKNSQTYDQSSPPTLSARPQPSSPTCDEACQQGRENLKIQNRLAWLTGGLVLVGLLQVASMIWQAILLRHTRGDVRRQADTMETQAKDARESSAQTFAILKEQNENLFLSAKAATANALAADESAKSALGQIKMIKDRERARLVIRRAEYPKIFPPEPTLDGGRALKVRVLVENLGGSRAFNVRAYGMVDIVSDPKGGAHEVGFLQDFPWIVDLGSGPYTLDLAGFGREFEGVATTGDSTVITEKLAQQIRDGEAFIKQPACLSMRTSLPRRTRPHFSSSGNLSEMTLARNG